jgi:hypothetical protein
MVRWRVPSAFGKRYEQSERQSNDAAVVGRLISEKLVHSGLDQISGQLASLTATVDIAVAQIDELVAQREPVSSAPVQTGGLGQLQAQFGAEFQRVLAILQAIYDEEPENRRRLWRLRESEEYELAFSEEQPLVSIVIPTYDNYRALGERSLPSALAQTYENLEVVVVGDAAPAETKATIARFDDERVRFYNLERRGPYSPDPQKLWLVGGTPPYNTAVHLARGRWIAYLGDDDSFRPDHLERLVARARADRLELCYGLLVEHKPDGGQAEIGAFPPSLGQFGFQSAIYHAGLGAFLEFELTDAEFGTPVDWGLCRRMLHAGVRMGFVPEATSDYFPSRDWTGRKERHEARHESDA